MKININSYYTHYDKVVNDILKKYRFSKEIDILKLEIETDKFISILLDSVRYDEENFIYIRWFFSKDYEAGLGMKKTLEQRDGYLLNIINSTENKYSDFFILAMLRMHYIKLSIRKHKFEEMVEIDKSDLSHSLKEKVLATYLSKYNRFHLKKYVSTCYPEDKINDLSFVIDRLDVCSVQKSKIMLAILEAYNDIRLFNYFSKRHKITLKHYRKYRDSIHDKLKEVYSHSLGYKPYFSMQLPQHTQDTVYLLMVELEDFGLPKDDISSIVQTISSYKRLPKISLEMQEKYRYIIVTKNKVMDMQIKGLSETKIWKYKKERSKLFKSTYGHSDAYIQKIRK